MTNEKFWDCECETNYIHSKALSQCEKCGAKQEGQPDSIDTEVQDLMAKERAVKGLKSCVNFIGFTDQEVDDMFMG